MRIYAILFVLAAFFLAGCVEVAPVVTGSMGGPIDPGPDLGDQKRQVLIEEFTGIRCVNCPAGSAEIEVLLSTHGPQLVAVSIHAGEFAPPYPNSLFDFRTQVGNQLLSYLGEPFGYPTAVVNRKKFDGQFNLQLSKGEWAGYIADEKAIPPKVRIGIEPDFNATSRDLAIKVTLRVDETITDPDVRLSIMFTESGIQDMQLTPSSSQPKADYVHKHVLRGMATPFDGVPLTESLAAGSVITKTFNYAVPANWKEDNCKVIAHVSISGAQKDVLQVHQVKMVKG